VTYAELPLGVNGALCNTEARERRLTVAWLPALQSFRWRARRATGHDRILMIGVRDCILVVYARSSARHPPSQGS
jgi:hypothetical protein